MAKGKFTKELFETICNQIANSDKGLVSICKEHDLNANSFYEWIAKDKELGDKYACARELQAEYLADQIIEIADNTAKDTIHVENEAGGYDMPNHEWINRSKLRVDARKWKASKLAPKKFGDKIDVTSGGDKIEPITKIQVEIVSPKG